MTLGRREAVVVIGLLCVLAITTGTALLRMRQHVTRVHLQHTLDKLRNVEVGTLHACEVFAEWQNEWESHLSSEGTCDDSDHFYTAIDVRHPPYLWAACFQRQFGRARRLLVRGVCGTYEALSGRTFDFKASVRGVRGVVTGKSFAVFQYSPDDSADEDLPAVVSASAMTPARLDRPAWRDTQSDVQQQRLHPSYRVFVNTGRINQDYDPQGRVFYIQVEIGPDGNRSDVDRLSQLNLSCLTRMRPCSRQDLMPAAYAQYEEDLR